MSTRRTIPLESLIGRVRNGAAMDDLSLGSVSPVLAPIISPAAEVGIADVKPYGAVAAQYATHLAENFDQLPDILFRCWFKPKLSIDAVIP
jgi:hypothetical protein